MYIPLFFLAFFVNAQKYPFFVIRKTELPVTSHNLFGNYEFTPKIYFYTTEFE